MKIQAEAPADIEPKIRKLAAIALSGSASAKANGMLAKKSVSEHGVGGRPPSSVGVVWRATAPSSPSRTRLMRIAASPARIETPPDEDHGDERGHEPRDRDPVGTDAKRHENAGQRAHGAVQDVRRSCRSNMACGLGLCRQGSNAEEADSCPAGDN
jgi:hypothetical protein